MSFLTRLFIVLHVVLTLVFVSAAVVFVNRVETFQLANKGLQDKLTVAEMKAQTASDEGKTAQSDAKLIQVQASQSVDQARQETNAALGQVRERDAQLATAQQNLASADARLQATTAALQTSQKTNGAMQEQLSQIRQGADKTQQQNTELLTANADLNSKYQTALRQVRNANEELESVRNEVADFRDRGGAAASADANAPQTTTQAINGVISGRRDINGVQYATINVGSSDQVKPRMKFNVIDRQTGSFLGYLTVDRVETNEATGRLEGPRVGEIKQNNEVRTQL